MTLPYFHLFLFSDPLLSFSRKLLLRVGTQGKMIIAILELERPLEGILPSALSLQMGKLRSRKQNDEETFSLFCANYTDRHLVPKIGSLE